MKCHVAHTTGHERFFDTVHHIIRSLDETPYMDLFGFYQLRVVGVIRRNLPQDAAATRLFFVFRRARIQQNHPVLNCATRIVALVNIPYFFMFRATRES